MKYGYINKIYLVIVLFTVLSPVFCLAQTTEDEIPDISKRINSFTMDWMRQCSKDPEASANTIVSPQSIFHCLAMSYIASGGNTRSELAQVLHYPTDNSVLVKDLASLRKSFDETTVKDRLELIIGNSAWMDEEYADFREDYLRNIKNAFGAEVFPIQFRPSQAACDRINRWISDQTRERIPGCLSPEDLPSKSGPGIVDEPALVTINTIYFKADWGSRFSKKDTQKKSFHLDSSTKIDTDMMHQRSVLSYAEDDTVQFLEIPYLERKFSMLVILPKDIVSVQSLAEWMDQDRIMALIRKASIHEVDVLFPGFILRSHFNCKRKLNAMGVQDAFNNQAANFDKMIHKRIEAFRIYLHEVLHDSWIEVNEEGTEAASATAGIQFSFGCSAPARPDFAKFHADHPFLFFIVHNSSKSILFSGWISNPKEFEPSRVSR